MPEEGDRQRGLKIRSVSLYVIFRWGVTHSTMSSAVQPFTQMKARIGIMTVVESNMRCTVQYTWLLPKGFIDPDFSLCKPFLLRFYSVNMTQRTPEGRHGQTRVLTLHAMHCIVWVMRWLEDFQYYTLAAGIDGGLQLSSPCLSRRCSLPLQASITSQIIGPHC